MRTLEHISFLIPIEGEKKPWRERAGGGGLGDERAEDIDRFERELYFPTLDLTGPEGSPAVTGISP